MSWSQSSSVPAHIAKQLKLQRIGPGLVLEGGSIDVNGAGKMLTTEECLLSDVQARELAARRHRRGAIAVERFHAREILGWFGLAGEHGAHEIVFGRGLKCPTHQSFVAECRGWNRAERLAARRAGAVPRPDLEMCRQRIRRVQRPIETASHRLHRSADVRGALEKIGAADVSREEEIAREHSDRNRAGRRVGDDEAHVFRRVTWRVPHVHRQGADVEVVAVAKEARAVGVGKRVLPIASPFARDKQLGPGSPRQFARTRHKIRVNVRLGDGHDPHVCARGLVEIAIHVTVRVDDHRQRRVVASNEVRGLRKPVLVYPSEKHAGEWLASAVHATQDSAMRCIFGLCLALAAFSRAGAQTTETPVPFDSAHRVLVITPALAERLRLADPAWPVRDEYRDVHLYASSQGGFVLVALLPTGSLKRYELSEAQRLTLGAAIDAAMTTSGRPIGQESRSPLTRT